MNNEDKHHYCTNKFIDLANELKKEDIDPPIISGALMMASGVYATYVAAGNNGALEASGIDKVVAVYRRALEQHQQSKKSQLTNEKLA